MDTFRSVSLIEAVWSNEKRPERERFSKYYKTTEPNKKRTLELKSLLAVHSRKLKSKYNASNGGPNFWTTGGFILWSLNRTTDPNIAESKYYTTPPTIYSMMIFNIVEKIVSNSCRRYNWSTGPSGPRLVQDHHDCSEFQCGDTNQVQPHCGHNYAKSSILSHCLLSPSAIWST